MAAYEDDDLKNNLNQADLVLPDGIGVVIGSKLIGRPLKRELQDLILSNNYSQH